MIRLCPVLLGILPVGDGEVLCTCAQGVLHEHPMSDGLPRVHPISDTPSDGVGCGDMSGLLQNHCMEDDGLLQVPLSVLHPAQLSPQRLDESCPDFPAWCIILPRWHDREAPPPRLPRRVIVGAAVKVCARVGLLPLTGRYQTYLISQRLRRLSCTFYIDTLFEKQKYIIGNTWGQIFMDREGFVFVHPIRSKLQSGQVFECSDKGYWIPKHPDIR